MSPEIKCVVPGCSVEPSSENVNLYSFPVQTALISVIQNCKTVYYSIRRIWLNKLGLDETRLDKNSAVCSSHFGEQDFIVSGTGEKLLKENAVPSKNLPTNSDPLDVTIKDNEKKSFENYIETIEKSDDDDDDDVEIIEPKREIITLDDDDYDELIPAENLSVKKDTNEPSDSSTPNKSQTTETKLATIVNGSNLPFIAKSAYSPIKVAQIESNGSSKQTSPTAIISAQGKKYMVRPTLKTGKLRPILPKKTILLDPKATNKIETQAYKMQIFKGKNGKPLTAKDVTGALKEQLTDFVEKGPKFLNSLLPGTKVTIPVQELKNLQKASSNSKQFVMEDVAASTSHDTSFSNKNPCVIYMPKFNKNETLENKAPSKEVGFSEMYDFINDNMINFTFNLFDCKYILKGCTLNFDAIKGNKKCSTTVEISSSSLSSSDQFLLNGINVSLGLSNNTLKNRTCTKVVKDKSEIIQKIEDEKEKNNLNKPVRSVKKMTKNKQEFIETRVDTPGKSKIIIHPVMPVDKPNEPKTSNKKVTDVESMKKNKLKPAVMNNRKRVMKRKNVQLSRQLLDMAISQMNPTLMGRLLVSSNKLKKTRRVPLINTRDKKVEEGKKDDNLKKNEGSPRKSFVRISNRSKSSDEAPSTSKSFVDAASTSKSSIEASSPDTDKSSNITTRSYVKKIKRNYKNLNSYGTTDEDVLEDIKTKCKSPKSAKKTKYSEKVGHIESFLEVVLEPDNNKDEMLIDTNEKDPIGDDSF